MVRFKVGGHELEEVTQIPLHELCEAEKALGMDLETTGLGGRTAIMLFVAMRRAHPGKPITLLADEVMAADFTSMEAVEEDPPAETAADETGGQETEHPQTTGPPPLGVSA